MPLNLNAGLHMIQKIDSSLKRFVKLSTMNIVLVSLWVSMWLNLNTGFWQIQIPSTAEDLLLLIRATLPFFVLPLAVFLLLRRAMPRFPNDSPSRFLFAYGLIAAIAATFSPVPAWSAYWSTTFLATILVAWTFIDRRNPVLSARMLLQITWVATFIVAAILAYETRNSVFGNAASAYGIVGNDLNGLSRSSGVARWAAVPGLVCIVRIFHTRQRALIAFYLYVASISFYIVYRMQSRGAVFGSAAALLFILLVSNRMRRFALPFAIISMTVVLLLETPEVVSNRVSEYLERGQGHEQFVSMTGRTRAYEHGLAAFYDAPIFGRGQWADRLTIGEHVHNSYLQALLNGGIVGGIPYLVSWVAGWILFFRLQRRRRRLSAEDRVCLLEAGAVMMFFTIRAIPETTTASFSVDLLVMVAVYVYMETLTVSALRRPMRAKSPIYLRTHGVRRTVRLPYAS
jgi:O-antigen ligase